MGRYWVFNITNIKYFKSNIQNTKYRVQPYACETPMKIQSIGNKCVVRMSYLIFEIVRKILKETKG